MKRTIDTREDFHVSAILTSDWHLREDVPVCRTDDYIHTQWHKVLFISSLQHRYNCPIFHAGDLFNHWRSSPHLLANCMLFLPKSFCTVYGQHDLPQHNLSLAYKCGAYALAAGEHIELLKAGHFGDGPYISYYGKRKIMIWHHLVWTGTQPWPRCTEPDAHQVLEKYNSVDLALTGDNHKPFVIEHRGRLLVNPGSLMRMTADQENHRPRVYLWDAKTNTVRPEYLPIKEGVVSRAHIEHIQKRDERIAAFISKLSDEWDVDVDFATNLERFERENKVNARVMQIIRKAMEKL